VSSRGSAKATKRTRRQGPNTDPVTRENRPGAWVNMRRLVIVAVMSWWAAVVRVRPAGGTTASSQTTNSAVYTFPSYTYNFNNQLKTITYPSGRTITTTYDSAGRAGQVSGQVNNVGAITTYGTVSAYAPHGGIQQMTLGALTEQTCYNNRLQAVGIRLGNGAMPLCGNSADVLNLSFNYGTTNNNGNLLSQTIMRPGSSWTEGYSYNDGMNRLTSAVEGSAWSQTYLYDGYGNRAVSSTSTIPNPYATATAITQFASNRWLGTGAAYDNNGN